MSRNGKIARLPRALRDELNKRMQDGQSSVSLVKWLNGLPEAQETLRRDFAGRPFNEQNLTEWKSGGHREWLARQETLAHARELAVDARELTEATENRLTDDLAIVVAARYAAALAEWNGEADQEFRRKLSLLHQLCQDIVELRRGDHSGARLKLEQERLGREKEKSEAEVLEQFRQWAQNAHVRESICRNWLSPEERKTRLDEIFGLKPKTVGEQAADPAGQELPKNQAKSG